MERKIIKCEILLTRKCNYKCKYCAIRRNIETNRDFGLWKDTLQALKLLGSEINPIYGAEPLLEKDLLLKILKYSAEIDMPNTLITNASLITGDVAKELYDSGLRSITFSYDGNYIFADEFSARKSSHAERAIEIFKKFDMRDIEIVVTVSRRNFRELEEILGRFSEMGVWVSFDLIHWDRGQPDSKCPPRHTIEDLLFTKQHIRDLKTMLTSLKKKRREEGRLLHQDDRTIDIICNNLPGYTWSCNDFGFITLEADLTVRPCDDFCPQEIRGKYTVPDLLEKWDEFQTLRKSLRKKYKCRCLWSTHIMSEIMYKEREAGAYFRHERY